MTARGACDRSALAVARLRANDSNASMVSSDRSTYRRIRRGAEYEAETARTATPSSLSADSISASACRSPAVVPEDTYRRSTGVLGQRRWLDVVFIPQGRPR